MNKGTSAKILRQEKLEWVALIARSPRPYRGFNKKNEEPGFFC
jgi:hypothetical protein